MTSSGIADLAQDLPGLLCVEMFEPFAPFQIARARHRIRIARHHPAAQMLAARRQAQLLRSLGAQLQHPFGQPLRVKQLAGVRDARHLLDMRVARILLVEPPQGGGEAVRVAGLECLSHRLGLMSGMRLWWQAGLDDFYEQTSFQWAAFAGRVAAPARRVHAAATSSPRGGQPAAAARRCRRAGKSRATRRRRTNSSSNTSLARLRTTSTGSSSSRTTPRRCSASPCATIITMSGWRSKARNPRITPSRTSSSSAPPGSGRPS